MDKQIFKEYLPNSAKGANSFYRVEVYYSLGGYNCFSYKQEPRGYFLSVQPVEREQRGGIVLESFVGFTGVKILLLACERQSKKAEQQALEMWRGELPRLMAHFEPKPAAAYKDKIYKVVTESGVQTYSSAEELTEQHEQRGEHKSEATREELQGAPVLRGLVGPMYDGEQDGRAVIRYESAAVYEILSR